MRDLVKITMCFGLMSIATAAYGGDGDLTVGGKLIFSDQSYQTTSGPVFGAPDVIVYDGIPSAVSSFQAGTAYTTIDLSQIVGSRKALVYLSIEPTAAVTVAFRESGEPKSVGYNDDSWAGWGTSSAIISGTEIGYATAVTNEAGKIDMMVSVRGTITVKLKAFVTK